MNNLTAEMISDLRMFLLRFAERHNAESYIQPMLKDNVIKDNVDLSLEFALKFKSDFEFNFFKEVFPKKQPSIFYHYTSLDALFNILKNGNVYLSPLTGLNDRKEVALVNEYMGAAHDRSNSTVLMYHNEQFILSCSKKNDDLQQWRIYGDDAAGAIIKFRLNTSSTPYRNIMLMDVIYGLDDFTAIKQFQKEFEQKHKIKFGFSEIDNWKFFYKDESYEHEAEVRLLLKNPDLYVGNELLNDPAYCDYKSLEVNYRMNRYGIITPYIKLGCIENSLDTVIRIDGIMLGAKCPEINLNVFQIRNMIYKVYRQFYPEILADESFITISKHLDYR